MAFAIIDLDCFGLTATVTQRPKAQTILIKAILQQQEHQALLKSKEKEVAKLRHVVTIADQTQPNDKSIPVTCEVDVSAKTGDDLLFEGS